MTSFVPKGQLGLIVEGAAEAEVYIEDITSEAKGEEVSQGEEAVYENALGIALMLEKIPHEKQRVLPVFYKNFAVGTTRSDLIVKDIKGKEKIVLELKATTKIGQKEELQLKKYLESLKMKKGMIINFPQITNTSKETPKDPEFIVVE